MTKSILQCRPPAIFIMGPTASGKTALVIALSQKLPVEIISVDSGLIYQGMNIGTAKPNTEEQAQAPHRLLDILDPSIPYSVANFCCDALKEMVAITASGRIPILVGGTMLYFKALMNGLSPLPPANYELRKYLEHQAQKNGWPALLHQLKQIDPVAANRIHPNDPQRILRALEVFFISGRTITELLKTSGESLAYQIHQFAIMPRDRMLLHQRIEQRFHQMLASGFEQEVSALFARHDLNKDMPSMRCVGYRQIWSYLAGETNYNQMVFHGICATRQLAKRQITWLRSWQKVHWLDSDDFTKAINSVSKVISVYVQ